ncbi:caspase-3-like [Asterias amurensis]|uniref:caspase-3-like n=1 Tax=Asterias amurensis TaxID=7602 RepID=UPI003AB42B50
MSRTGKPKAHSALLVHLTRAIDGVVFNRMKTTVKTKEYGGFLAGELEKLDTPQKLLDKMEHKGVFKVKTHPSKTVDYRNLKMVFEQCEFNEILSDIESAEAELAKEGFYVEGGDQADAGCTSVSVMETDRPLNKNNSRSDRSDAIPSGVTLSESGDKDFNPEGCYNKGKGYLLFINNFENSGEPRRKGSEKDKDKIETLFEEDSSVDLNFKCSYEKDLTKTQLLKVLHKTRDKLATGKYSSFVMILGSHGKQEVVKDNEGKEATVEGIVTIDQKFITEEELTKPFLGDELKALNDKPKVFIIQACRAPRRDKADDMETSSSEETPDEPTQATFKKPVNADMLISYATSKGTKAWRNDDGTWYISELCEGIKKYSKKKHLLDILVRVNHAISLRESTEDGAKQMPCQISTLTKDYWLNR